MADVKFEIGDECTYMFRDDRVYTAGKIVQIENGLIHFEFKSQHSTAAYLVPFRLDGTGIARGEYPRGSGGRFVIPAPFTDGTDLGAYLRFDRRPVANEEASQLAANLREALQKADEAEAKLRELGWIVHRKRDDDREYPRIYNNVNIAKTTTITERL